MFNFSIATNRLFATINLEAKLPKGYFYNTYLFQFYTSCIKLKNCGTSFYNSWIK